MGDEEIERLTIQLREMLFRSGFGWAAVEAEEPLYPTVTVRTRALALISAAEMVTVELAALEMEVDDLLGGQGIRFKPDEAGRDDEERPLEPREREVADFEPERLFGPQRRAVLEDLSARRELFTVLRRRINDPV